MPQFLSLADLIVLPLQDTLLARSQVPCKIFEAMAMSRPIIASDVSDMATILDDSGWVVPAGDVAALAEQIREVFANPAEAKRRGEKARERCLAHYSSEVTRRSLVSLIRGIVG
ncbi:MAG: glycosyltransferase [Kiritimatiellae bacterium]|nr:glycosyltransferase [Kiritimatiellia bacterium]